ncbi:hypothetical protein SFB1_193G1 [Candidatus Arthromitus sp. SFB-1]|nr:hypothetical protein SFB1_193G1 [Candidatus Arthromitus sp. SFB-1]
MAIFLDSFSIKKPVIEKKVCLIHPIEKKYIMKNISSIEYSSHINIILTHNKIVDDINDENNLLSKILLPISNKLTKSSIMTSLTVMLFILCRLISTADLSLLTLSSLLICISIIKFGSKHSLLIMVSSIISSLILGIIEYSIIYFIFFYII